MGCRIFAVAASFFPRFALLFTWVFIMSYASGGHGQKSRSTAG